jgi:hypothetical protein
MFVHPDYFLEHWLPFATGFLNKNLSSVLAIATGMTAALYAIRKLAARVKKWQDNHPDFVFPFKDFLVQFLCDSQFSDHSALLACLSLLMPIQPVRFCEKLTFVSPLLQTLVEGNDLSNTVVRFYELFLDCVPQLESFVHILRPFFPWILVNENWKLILTIIHRLCQRWTILTIPDAFRPEIQNFIVAVAPLILSDEAAMATEVFFILLSVQSKILDNPLPDLTQASVDRLHDFLSCDQAFQVMLGLLTLFKDRQIAFHRREAALLIQRLLAANAENRPDFDTAIVSSTLAIVQMELPDDIVDLLLDNVGFLRKLRLHSVLPAIASSACERNFPKLFARLCDPRESTLLVALTEMLQERPANWFVWEAILLSRPAIADADDETFVRLFLAILTHTNEISSPLFDPFFSHETMGEIADHIGRNRPQSFPFFLKFFPPSPTDSLVRLALCCAAVCPDLCPQFLGYASEHLTVAHIPELTPVCRAVPREKFGDLNHTVIAFLLANADSEPFVDAAAKFADFPPLWAAFAESALASPAKFARPLLRVLERADVSPRLILPLLPAVLLDPAFSEVCQRLSGGAAVIARLPPEDCAVLRADIAARVRASPKKEDGLLLLCALCQELTAVTADAVGLIVDALPSVAENAEISAALRRLIATPD